MSCSHRALGTSGNSRKWCLSNFYQRQTVLEKCSGSASTVLTPFSFGPAICVDASCTPCGVAELLGVVVAQCCGGCSVLSCPSHWNQAASGLECELVPGVKLPQGPGVRLEHEEASERQHTWVFALPLEPRSSSSCLWQP